MSTRFFGFRVPSGQPFQGRLGDENRPDIIRRIECYYCPMLVTYHFPTDEEGNPLPKHVCKILDLENAVTEQENAKRHPTEQLLYKNCIYGEMPLPPYFPNASDLIPR